jgi:hypothetical protein
MFGGEESKARILVIGAHERPILASVSKAISGNPFNLHASCPLVEQVAGFALSQEPQNMPVVCRGGIASLLNVLEDRGGHTRADTETPEDRFVGAHSQAVFFACKVPHDPER